MTKVLAVLIAAFVLLVPAVYAQQRVTTEVQPGEVVVRNETDGTIYLTTEVAPSSSSSTPAATLRPTPQPRGTIRSPLANVNIELPEGFAASFSNLFNGVLSFVLVIAALLVLLFLIWGAFDWITSGGDKGKTDKARQKIVSAIIGIIIIASSYAILTLVLRFLGFIDINDVFDSAGTIQGAPTFTPMPTPTPSPTPIVTPTPDATFN